jgi:hypothetical protein
MIFPKNLKSMKTPSGNVPVLLKHDYGDQAEVIPLYWANYSDPVWCGEHYASKDPASLPTVLVNKDQLS